MKFDNVYRNIVRSRSDMLIVCFVNLLSLSCVYRVLVGCGGGGVSDCIFVDWGIDEVKLVVLLEKLWWMM